jgi:hypothetical protein
MNCDSCNVEAGPLTEQKFVRWNVSLSWPPVQRRRVVEYWCLECAIGIDPEGVSKAGAGGDGI